MRSLPFVLGFDSFSLVGLGFPLCVIDKILRHEVVGGIAKVNGS